MTRGNVRPRRKLELCPNCNSDSGERRRVADKEIYCVVCSTCGARTRYYGSMGAATRAWGEGRCVKNGRKATDLT